MTSLFPLYEILCSRIEAKGGVVDPNIDSLRNYMQSLTIEQSIHVSLIIITFYHYSVGNLTVFNTDVCNVKGKKPILPYDIKISPNGKGFIMDIKKIPEGLRALIWEYCIE